MSNETPQPNTLPVMCFIFSVLSACFCATMTGLVSGGATLIVAVIQFSLLPSYLVLSTLLLKTGDNLNGNLFAYFCAFFAGVGGATSIVQYLAGVNGWVVDGSVLGIVWIFIGLMLCMVLPAWKDSPWTFFTIDVLTVIGLILMGLITLGVLPAALLPVPGWIFGVISLLGLYCAASMHLATGNVNLPMGPPFFKQKQ